MDKLFMLSVEEAKQYFSSNEDRAATPVEGMFETHEWWLRSPGMFGAFAAFVAVDGEIKPWGKPCNEEIGFRPAMWISCDT